MQSNNDISKNNNYIVKWFSAKIEDAIMNWRVVAVSDASMERYILATHWILMNSNNSTRTESRVMSVKWNEGMVLAGEEVLLVEIVTKIKQKIADANSREVFVYNDDKLLSLVLIVIFVRIVNAH